MSIENIAIICLAAACFSVITSATCIIFGAKLLVKLLNKVSEKNKFHTEALIQELFQKLAKSGLELTEEQKFDIDRYVQKRLSRHALDVLNLAINALSYNQSLAYQLFNKGLSDEFKSHPKQRL